MVHQALAPPQAPPAPALRRSRSGAGRSCACSAGGRAHHSLRDLLALRRAPRAARLLSTCRATLTREPSAPPPLGNAEPEPELEKVAQLRLRAQRFLAQVDGTGAWTVISATTAFGLFLLETLNDDRFGGWDVLFRDDLPIYYGVSVSTLGAVEASTNTLFLLEYLLRAWVAGGSFAFFSSPLNLIDLASASPPLFGLLGASPQALRLLRVCRVLRLLRLLDRAPDSVLFGMLRSDDMNTQLLGVAAEFICIFAVAAGVVFDLEVNDNPAVHNLSDTLYWAFLTLTGIGQPFEIVTPAGKVATVIAVLVALVTIPGQLAKLASVSMASGSERATLMEYMTEAERAVFISSGGKAAPGGTDARRTLGVGAMRSAASTAASAILDRNGGGAAAAAAPAPDAGSEDGGLRRVPGQRFRRTLVTQRRCLGGECELTVHDHDAVFCKGCGAELE